MCYVISSHCMYWMHWKGSVESHHMFVRIDFALTLGSDPTDASSVGLKFESSLARFTHSSSTWDSFACTLNVVNWQLHLWIRSDRTWRSIYHLRKSRLNLSGPFTTPHVCMLSYGRASNLRKYWRCVFHLITFIFIGASLDGMSKGNRFRRLESSIWIIEFSWF